MCDVTMTSYGKFQILLMWQLLNYSTMTAAAPLSKDFYFGHDSSYLPLQPEPEGEFIYFNHSCLSPHQQSFILVSGFLRFSVVSWFPKNLELRKDYKLTIFGKSVM